MKECLKLIVGFGFVSCCTHVGKAKYKSLINGYSTTYMYCTCCHTVLRGYITRYINGMSFPDVIYYSPLKVYSIFSLFWFLPAYSSFLLSACPCTQLLLIPFMQVLQWLCAHHILHIKCVWYTLKVLTKLDVTCSQMDRFDFETIQPHQSFINYN